MSLKVTDASQKEAALLCWLWGGSRPVVTERDAAIWMRNHLRPFVARSSDSITLVKSLFRIRWATRTIDTYGLQNESSLVSHSTDLDEPTLPIGKMKPPKTEWTEGHENQLPHLMWLHVHCRTSFFYSRTSNPTMPLSLRRKTTLPSQRAEIQSRVLASFCMDHPIRK